MKKRIECITVVMIFLLCLLPVTASAASGDVDGNSAVTAKWYKRYSP